MTITTASNSRPEAITPEMVRTARTTGLLHLGPQHETLARLGIVIETGVVITQALVTLWFYRLFRSVNALVAGSIAAFGLVNSVAILGSAAMLATALDVSMMPR